MDYRNRTPGGFSIPQNPNAPATEQLALTLDDVLVADVPIVTSSTCVECADNGGHWSLAV